jgi:hypothetical protein
LLRARARLVLAVAEMRVTRLLKKGFVFAHTLITIFKFVLFHLEDASLRYRNIKMMWIVFASFQRC